MSDTIKGFLINGEILHYDYNALDNVPDNGAGTFWATYGTTTSNEIEGAIASNKTVALNYENNIYYLSSILDKIAPSNVYLFRSEDNVANYQIMMSGSNWQPVRVLDWIQPSNDDPLPLLEDGVSSPGTSAKYSRSDHRHPMPEMNLGIDQTDGLLYFYINNVKHGNGIPISGGSSGSGLTNEIKQALLQLASKVAYIDANGQSYYQALYDALYSTPKVLVSISATYNQTDTIYTTDSLNDIPSRGTLTVIATYDDSSTETITNYTLSGNLTAGTSTITVIYSGKTTTINVNVTAVVGTYTIINNLTGCSTSNNATTIIENNSYNATITASSGYTLTGATASVTMGGNTVTGAYSNGTISIANVTGDIVITVTAAARTVSSISAVFNQGDNKIYVGNNLDSLHQYLIVTAVYSDGVSEEINNYTLSGVLEKGTSTITAGYNGKTATFDVIVSDTAPEIEAENYALTSGDPIAATGFGYTIIYPIAFDENEVTAHPRYDSTNDYITQNGWSGITYYISDANTTAAGYNWPASNKAKHRMERGDICADFYSITKNSEITRPFPSNKTNAVHATGMRFTLPLLDLDDCYAYWYKPYANSILPIGVSTGDIIFAGKNTRYYGLSNISEAD